MAKTDEMDESDEIHETEEKNERDEDEINEIWVSWSWGTWLTADSEKEQDVGVTSLSFQKMLWVMEQAVTQLVQVVMLHHLQASGLGLWSFEI